METKINCKDLKFYNKNKELIVSLDKCILIIDEPISTFSTKDGIISSPKRKSWTIIADISFIEYILIQEKLWVEFIDEEGKHYSGEVNGYLNGTGELNIK